MRTRDQYHAAALVRYARTMEWTHSDGAHGSDFYEETWDSPLATYVVAGAPGEWQTLRFDGIDHETGTHSHESDLGTHRTMVEAMVVALLDATQLEGDANYDYDRRLLDG